MDLPKNNPILDTVIEAGLQSIAIGKDGFEKNTPQWRALNVMENYPRVDNTREQNAMRFVTLCLVGGMTDQVCDNFHRKNGAAIK